MDNLGESGSGIGRELESVIVAGSSEGRRGP